MPNMLCHPKHSLDDKSCVLDGLTTMKKFSAPRIIRYSMPKQKNTYLLVYCINTTVKQKLKLLGVIPCQINQRREPDHLRFSHKNYHIHWNVSLAYMQNFNFIS